MAVECDGAGHVAPGSGSLAIASVRLFIAVHLDPATREALAAASEALRAPAAGVPVAWVAAENFHVTLKFLGGVDEAKVPALIEALHSAVARQRGFRFQVGGLGAFPFPTRPRVLWAGVAVGAERLGALAQNIDEATARLGFPREARPFSPHITLGRVRDSRHAPALAQALEGAGTWPFGTVTIERVALMRSDLSPRGARYTTLAAVPMAPRPDVSQPGH